MGGIQYKDSSESTYQTVNCTVGTITQGNSADIQMNNFSWGTNPGSICDYKITVWMQVATGDTSPDTTVHIYTSQNGSRCTGHFVNLTSASSSCSTGSMEAVTISCSHSQAPATVSEAENDTWAVRVTNTTDSGGYSIRVDRVRHQLDYCNPVSTPGAPSSVEPAAPPDGNDTMVITRPTLDSDATQWQARETFAGTGWTSGWIASGTTTVNHTGLSNGTTYRYDIRARDASQCSAGGTCTSSYGIDISNTTDDVPDTSGDPTLNANAVGQIQVTKPTTPNGNGDPPTHWYVEWDNDSGFPSPTGNSGDIAVGTTTYNATGLGNGNNYYFRVRFKNVYGYGSYSVGIVNETTWDVPGTPSDPTLSIVTTQEIRVTKPTNPSDGGETIDYWYVQWDDNSGFPSPLGNSGDIAIGTTTYDITGLTGGQDYWVRVRFKNAVGYGNYSAGTVNDQAEDIPDSQDLVSATTPEGSMIRITRNASYPDGNGEPVDSWEVWRSTTSGGVYSELATGLTATTYDDWLVNGGETWYYKSKFTNNWGDSALSTNPVNATATKLTITKLSDTRILIPDNEITSTSDSAIFRAGYATIEPTSDTLIVDTFLIEPISNTRIKNTFLIEPTSDTRILVLDNEITNTSDTAIFQAAWDTIQSNSNTAIFQAGWGHLQYTSDSLILRPGEIIRVSNTTIFNPAWQDIQIVSDTAIYRPDFASLDIVSSSRIKNYTEFTKESDTHILNIQEVTTTTDTAIFRSGYGDIQTSSDTDILVGAYRLHIDSNSRILKSSLIEPTSDTFVVLTFEQTPLSDTAIFRSAFASIDKTSDSRIKLVDQELTKTSDTAVYVTAFNDINTISDTRIKREGGRLYPYARQPTPSDSRIKRIFSTTTKSLTRIQTTDNEFTKSADTLIIHTPIIDLASDSNITFSSGFTILSRTRIKNIYEQSPISDTRVKSIDNSFTKLSDSFIIHIIDNIKLSDTAIFKSGIQIQSTSDTTVKLITDIIQSSDSAIYRSPYRDIQIKSVSDIQILDREFTKLSDTAVKQTYSITVSSDTNIRRFKGNLLTAFSKG